MHARFRHLDRLARLSWRGRSVRPRRQVACAHLLDRRSSSRCWVTRHPEFRPCGFIVAPRRWSNASSRWHSPALSDRRRPGGPRSPSMGRFHEIAEGGGPRRHEPRRGVNSLRPGARPAFPAPFQGDQFANPHFESETSQGNRPQVLQRWNPVRVRPPFSMRFSTWVTPSGQC